MNDTTGRPRRLRRSVLGAMCATLLLGCGPAAGQTTPDADTTPSARAGGTPSASVADLHVPDGGMLHGIAARDGRIVGVGASAGRAAAWSLGPDDSWSGHQVPAAADLERLDTVALEGSSAVAFGGDWQRPSRLWVGDGATTWRAVDADAAGIDGRVNAVTAANGRWIAVGDRVDPEGGESYQGTVWTSDDGRSFAPAADMALAEGTLSDVAAIGDVIVVVGFDIHGGKVWTATDGRAFEPASGPFEASTVEGVAATDDGLTAVGRGVADLAPRTWTSDDGRRWRRVDVEAGHLEPEDAVHDVTAIDGVVVAVGATPDGGVVWTLEDGVWQRRP